MTAAANLYQQALALPPAQRADLAAQLLASVEPPAGLLSEDDPGFDAELERRAARFQAGDPGVPAADTFAQARSRLR